MIKGGLAFTVAGHVISKWLTEVTHIQYFFKVFLEKCTFKLCKQITGTQYISGVHYRGNKSHHMHERLHGKLYNDIITIFLFYFFCSWHSNVGLVLGIECFLCACFCAVNMCLLVGVSVCVCVCVCTCTYHVARIAGRSFGHALRLFW